VFSGYETKWGLLFLLYQLLPPLCTLRSSANTLAGHLARLCNADKKKHKDTSDCIRRRHPQTGNGCVEPRVLFPSSFFEGVPSRRGSCLFVRHVWVNNLRVGIPLAKGGGGGVSTGRAHDVETEHFGSSNGDAICESYCVTFPSFFSLPAGGY
jgi:hypothetical protein